jgi:hypothetical protein
VRRPAQARVETAGRRALTAYEHPLCWRTLAVHFPRTQGQSQKQETADDETAAYDALAPESAALLADNQKRLSDQLDVSDPEYVGWRCDRGKGGFNGLNVRTAKEITKVQSREVCVLSEVVDKRS